MKVAGAMIVFVACLSGAATSTLMYFAPQASDTRPLEVLPGTRKQLGLLRQGTDVNVLFTLVNHGVASLTIGDISVSCDCTHFDISTRSLAPGDNALLTLRYSTGSQRGQVQADSAVTYQMAIDPEFDVTPESLNFDIPDSLVRTVTLRPRHVQSVQIITANADKAFLATKLVSTADSGAPAVEVTLDADKYYPEAGPAALVVQTDCAKQKYLSVPIQIRRTR